MKVQNPKYQKTYSSHHKKSPILQKKHWKLGPTNINFPFPNIDSKNWYIQLVQDTTSSVRFMTQNTQKLFLKTHKSYSLFLFLFPGKQSKWRQRWNYKSLTSHSKICIHWIVVYLTNEFCNYNQPNIFLCEMWQNSQKKRKERRYIIVVPTTIALTNTWKQINQLMKEQQIICK